MKDAEERITELTDQIHSLYRGYVNASFSHKDEHLKLEKKLKEIKTRLKTIQLSVKAVCQTYDQYIGNDYVPWEIEKTIDSIIKFAEEE